MNKSAFITAPDETLLFEEGASHFHNFIAVGGQLFLTNQRLIFKSCSTHHYQHEIAIPLNQIAGVEFFKTLFMNPNGLALMLPGGQMENFIVDDKKAWKSRIMSLIQQIA